MSSNVESQLAGRDLLAAVTVALLWSLAGMSLAASASRQCNVERYAIRLCQGTQSTPNAAACRIHNQLPGGVANVGSGTLIDVAADGGRGLILTCAHLFTEGVGQVVVEFPNGKTHGALVVAIDGQADLAALEISGPGARPVEINQQVAAEGHLTACGFGPSGVYRCIAGPLLGYTEGPGQTSARIGGAVRSGDSGGGVFDNRGRLVAVVWGESGGVTYASTGRPLGRFLERTLGRRPGSGVAPAAPVTGLSGGVCLDGSCPLVGGGMRTPSPSPVAPPVALGSSCDCGDALSTIAARLGELEGWQASPGSSAVGGNDGAPERRPPNAFGGSAQATALLATTLLGISGPAGWGVIAASTVGGWLVGCGLQRRRLRAASRELREEATPSTNSEASPSQLAAHGPQAVAHEEASAAAERGFQTTTSSTIVVDEQSPIERDDREARELLRLSQLEGRDPLQDAVAGRLALDRLDSLAESDADPQRVAWADALRRELRERFNDIAPTKFQFNTEG